MKILVSFHCPRNSDVIHRIVEGNSAEEVENAVKLAIPDINHHNITYNKFELDMEELIKTARYLGLNSFC